jgi:hypothetical protein
MRMDPGFYEDLAGRLYGLLIGLEDRLDKCRCLVLAAHDQQRTGESGASTYSGRLIFANRGGRAVTVDGMRPQPGSLRPETLRNDEGVP